MILIVNADDFGMSAGVNHGIVQAHQSGIVTSASLMVLGAAAAEAAILARKNPQLAVGLHVDLGEWVYVDDCWQAKYLVVRTDDASAVGAEVTRQLDAFRLWMGCDPTHLDSHQHVHHEDPARSVMQEAACKLGIPLRQFHPGIAYCGNFYGQSSKGHACGDAISVESLLEIIRSLSERITELACHPASSADMDSTYREERIQELQSLCDPRVHATLAAAGVELQSFRDLRNAHSSRLQ